MNVSEIDITYFDGDMGALAKEWLLYAYSVVYPFFVFSVVASRDSLSLWIVSLMFLLFVARFIHSGGKFWWDRSFGFLLAFFAAYSISTLLVVDAEAGNSWLGRTPVDRAIAIDLRVASALLSLFVFVQLLADVSEKVLFRVFRIQIYVGLAVAAFGLLQYVAFAWFGSTALSGIEPTNESYVLRGNFFRLGMKRFYRATSIFNEPSYFGFFLVPLLTKTFIAKREGMSIGGSQMHNWILIVLVLSVIANFSFTAILSIIVLSAPILAMSLRRSPKIVLYSTIGAMLVIAALLASPIGPAIIERLERVVEIRDGSTLDRLHRAFTGAQVFVSSPLTGVGPGGYAFWYPRLGGLDSTLMATPLNIWLSILTDVGLLGIIPFLGFLYVLLIRAVRAKSRHPIIIVYVWSVVSYLVLLTTIDFWFLDFFWFELAMVIVLTHRLGKSVSSVARSHEVAAT